MHIQTVKSLPYCLFLKKGKICSIIIIMYLYLHNFDNFLQYMETLNQHVFPLVDRNHSVKLEQVHKPTKLAHVCKLLPLPQPLIQ